MTLTVQNKPDHLKSRGSGPDYYIHVLQQTLPGLSPLQHFITVLFWVWFLSIFNIPQNAILKSHPGDCIFLSSPFNTASFLHCFYSFTIDSLITSLVCFLGDSKLGSTEKECFLPSPFPSWHKLNFSNNKTEYLGLHF